MQTKPHSERRPRTDLRQIDAADLRRVEDEAYPTIEEIQHEAVRPVPRRTPLALAERFNRRESP